MSGQQLSETVQCIHFSLSSVQTLKDKRVVFFTAKKKESRKGKSKEKERRPCERPQSNQQMHLLLGKQNSFFITTFII